MPTLRSPIVTARALGALLLVLAAIEVPSGDGGGQQPGIAATQSQTPTARELVTAGMGKARAREFPEAERLLQSAVERAIVEGDVLARGNALWGLASVRGALGDLDGERRNAAAAEEAFLASGDDIALGNFLNSRALEANAKSDWAEAERRWTAALAAFDRAGDRVRQAQVLRNQTFLPTLDDEAKLVRLDQALALLPPGAPSPIVGAIHHQIGDVLFVLGDPAGAMVEVQAALPLLDTPTTRGDYGRALVSLARLNRTQGNPEEARVLAERAAGVLAAAGDQGGTAHALVASAIASYDLGRVTESLSTLERAVETARRGSHKETVAFALGQRAYVLAIAGRTTEAGRLIDEGLALASAAGTRSQLMAVRAGALFAAGLPEAALAAVDEAVATHGTMARDFQIQLHALRAQILERLGRPPDAVVSSGNAVELLERLRARVVPDDFFKRSFSERVRVNFALHIRLLISLGRTREAMEAAERARARAFLDLLATRDVRRHDADVTTATRPPADHAAVPGTAPGGTTSLAASQPAPTSTEAPGLQRGSPAPPSRGGRGGVVQQAAALHALESRVVAEPPDAGEVARVASSLSSTVISYWVDEHRTWAWVVSPDGELTFREIAVGERELTRRVRAAWALPDGRPTLPADPKPATAPAGSHTTLASGAGTSGDAPAAWTPLTRGGGRLVVESAARRAARELYDLLIAPLRPALPNTPGALLTIVAHGPLHRLSFAGLAAGSGRYLVEDFRIHYAPSIGLLRAAGRARDAVDTQRVLVVSDPLLPPGLARANRLRPLPGALAEGRTVAREAGDATVVALARRSASEARVREEVGVAGVLHFATHGVVSDDRPFESFLALAGRSTGDSHDDGRLTVAEVYELDLVADMVVLSACRSASGPVTGDGVTGLTRAFIYAGAPSVVASLWNLPDQATHVAVRQFYRAWRATGDKAEALRTAQIHLLRALREGRLAVDTPAGRLTLPEHPAIWAGLVLFGQP